MARTRPPSLMTADRARTVLPVPHVGAPLDSAVWAELLGLSAPSSVSVTGDNVRGLPALDKAKAMVVNSVATMLVNATVSDQTGSPMPVPTVIRRPHPLLGRFEYFAQIVDSLVMNMGAGGFVVGDRCRREVPACHVGAVVRASIRREQLQDGGGAVDVGTDRR